MFQIKVMIWNSATELLFIIKEHRMGGALFKIHSKYYNFNVSTAHRRLGLLLFHKLIFSY